MNVIGPKASPPAMASAHFADETHSSGLAHTYGGGSEGSPSAVIVLGVEDALRAAAAAGI